MAIPNPNPNIADGIVCDNKTLSSSKIKAVIDAITEAESEAIGAVDAKFNYSSTEEEIGTFEGKTVYRKYVNFGTLPSSSTPVGILITEDLIDTVLRYDVFAKAPTGVIMPLPNPSDSATWIISTYVTVVSGTGSSFVIEPGDNRDTLTGYAVIEYTKQLI